MRVRLKQAATVALDGVGHHWHPAGSEVEIPEDHFHPDLHESLDVEEAPEPTPAPEPVVQPDPPAAPPPSETSEEPPA